VNKNEEVLSVGEKLFEVRFFNTSNAVIVFFGIAYPRVRKSFERIQ
jgi:hypothetical protein